MTATAKPRLSAEDWILAGFRSLVEQGPGALKAEPLARKLGTTKGSFYWHFKDVADFHARLLSYWEEKAFLAVTEVVTREASPVARMEALIVQASEGDPKHGGHAAEPALRAWAASAPQVAEAVHRVDEQRLAFLRQTLAALDLTNPDFARLLYGAYIGMGTLAARDGTSPHDALSTLIAALLALRDA